MKLDNKVALVTGGTSGIGFQTAKRFIAEGAKVYIVGRRQEVLDRSVKELGFRATGLQGDISKQADLARIMSVISQANEKLDIVFANAGGGTFAPLGSISEEQYDKEFDINVKGTLFTVQHSLPLLRDGSSIILAGSIVSAKGMPAFSVYSATKAAIRSFARGWSNDLRDRKIRVNVIAPGTVPTESYETELKLSKEQLAGFVAQAASQTPAGRVGTTDDIAKAVVFLASDDSNFINGIELAVDGGMTQI